MDFTKYVNTVPYPSSTQFTTVYWYKGGKVVCTQKPGESLAAGFDTSKCVREKVVDDAGLTAARKAHYNEERRIHELFMADLFEDLCITTHPLREKLFSKAWSDGHANGFQEVYNCAQDLAELIELPAQSVLITKDAVVSGPSTFNWRDLNKAAAAVQNCCEANMIEVKQAPHQLTKWQVKLNGHIVGHIQKVDGHLFQYFPKDSKIGGDKFTSLQSVVSSLQGDD